MQIIDVDGKKYYVIEKVMLDHFKSEESKNKYIQGKLCLINKSNPNEYVVVNEIFDAKFEDIIEEKAIVETKEEESTQEELPPKQSGFSHTINIRM